MSSFWLRGLEYLRVKRPISSEMLQFSALTLFSRYVTIIHFCCLARLFATPSLKTMVFLHSLHLAHLPSSLTLHLALYEDVKNAAFLHQQLLDGNTEFEYAFIDASVVGWLVETTQWGSARQKLIAQILRSSPPITSWLPSSGLGVTTSAPG